MVLIRAWAILVKTMGGKEIKGTIFLTSLLRSDGAGHLPSPVELWATLPMLAVT